MIGVLLSYDPSFPSRVARAQDWEVLAEMELLQAADVPVPARPLTPEQVRRGPPQPGLCAVRGRAS